MSNSAQPKEQPPLTLEDLTVEMKKLNNNIAQLKKSQRKRNVIMRGVIYGMFTAIGASLGFAFFLSLLTGAIQSAEKIPFLEGLIQRTEIERIVEEYLQNNNKVYVQPSTAPTSIPTETPAPSNTPFPTSTPVATSTPTQNEVIPTL